MRIRRLKIRNFQSIKSASLDFTVGLNVIVGENGLGKSAVLRALRWVCRDSFRGTHFIRDYQRKCRVSAQVGKGVAIVREAERALTDDGKTSRLVGNKYVVRVKGEDDVEFNKFKNIPDEVTTALGMSQPLSFGTTKADVVDLNIADQHRDAIFLIDKPGSLAAKLLLRIIGVEPALRAMRVLSLNRRNLLQEEKRLNTDVEDISAIISGFPAETLEREFDILSSKVNAVKQLNRVFDSVTGLQLDWKQVINLGQNAVRQQRELKEALKLPWHDAENILQSIILLQSISQEYLDVNKRLQGYETKSTRLHQLELSVNKLLEKYTDVVEACEMYRGAEKELELAENDSRLINKRLLDATKEYDDMLSELGVCPLCGGDIK